MSIYLEDERDYALVASAVLIVVQLGRGRADVSWHRVRQR